MERLLRGDEPEDDDVVELDPIGSELIEASLRVHECVPPRFEALRWLRRTHDGSEAYGAVDRSTGSPVGLVLLYGVENIDHTVDRLRRIAQVAEDGLERIHEVIPHDDCLLYVTDLVDGPAVFDDDSVEVFAVARAVALALTALHSHQLVHGNVRSTSIRHTANGEPVLVDPDPNVHSGVAPREDWQALGELLQRFLDGADLEMRRFVGDLAAGAIGGVEVLARLLSHRGGGIDPMRYQKLRLLGRGGMGEVWRVRDPTLDRPVALKTMNPSHQHGGGVDLFLHEARLTSQLQHPGIPPVHEVGHTAAGLPYFTMKELGQRRLTDAILDVHDVSRGGTWKEGADGWNLRRLIEALAQAAEAIAYAHARDLIHRDIKPPNIMLGEFRAVYVLDWGLAQHWDPAELSHAPPPDRSWGLRPSARRFVGTAGYAAPEQVQGLVQGPASDVYSLGACLLEILTGCPPILDEAHSTYDPDRDNRPRASDPQRALDVAHLEIPGVLAEICRRAMSFTPDRRHPEAGVFAEALRDWLEGAQRREDALARLDGIGELERRIADARSEAAQLRRESEQRIEGVASHASIDQKIPAWEAESLADDLDRQAEEFDVAYLQTLRAALEICPELVEGRVRLADYYKDRLEDAEQRGDARSVTRYEQLLAPTRRHSAWLAGSGAVTLVTDPPGAQVSLHRWVVRHRHRVLVHARDLGTTPLDSVTVGRGSWVLEIRAEGRLPVRYPIRIGRGQHWDGVGPNGAGPVPIPLPKVGALTLQERYVPAGWFVAGGDPNALDGLPLNRLWADGFVLSAQPVTHDEYVRFLNALVDAGNAELAHRHVPREEKAFRQGDLPLYAQGEDGHYIVSGTRSEELHHHRSDAPVILVDWHSARAYAQWWSERTSEHWDLPHDLQWEKAARGVDGRAFPWGDRLDPTFACMAESHADAPRRAAVEAFPVDCSPYDVRGLGGNVREWCLNAYRRGGLSPGVRAVPADEVASGDDDLPMVRGGSWTSSRHLCRSAGRFACSPDARGTSIGFRLCRRFPT